MKMPINPRHRQKRISPLAKIDERIINKKIQIKEKQSLRQIEVDKLLKKK